MAQPTRYLIDALRKLDGDAFVSYPDKNLDVRRVERVFRVPRKAKREAFNVPQKDEYKDTELVDQHVVGGDANYIEIYQVWETLPGSELITKIKRTSIFDVIPPEFRVDEGLTVRDQVVKPDTDPDTVTGQVVEAVVAQESKSKARRKLTTRDEVDYPTLVDAVTNQRKQLVTVTRDITPNPTEVPSPTQAVTRKALGGGQFLEEVRTEPVFAEAKFETEIEDVLPRPFQAALTTRETDEIVIGAAAQPVLAAGDLSRGEEQLTAFEKRVRRKWRDVPGVVTLTNYRRNSDGQLVTKALTLTTDGSAPAVNSLTEDAEVEALGDGRFVRRIETVPSVLDKVVFEAERPEVLPERFRADLSTTTERHIFAGAAGTPTMNAGDQHKVERQLTAFLRETIARRREDAGLPAFDGQKYDEQLDIIHGYHEEVGNPATALGVNRKEVQPLKTGQALITTHGVAAITTALDNYFARFPGTTNVDLPRELTAVTGLVEWAGSNGTYNTTQNGYGLVNNGSGSIHIRASASGSASSMSEVFFTTREIWGRDVPCLHCLFFSPTVFTMAGLLVLLQARIGELVKPWPKFAPQPVEVVCRGGRIAGTQNTDAHASQSVIADYAGVRKLEGNIRNGGFGNSYDLAVLTKVHRTSDVIHGTVPLTMLAGSVNPQTTAFTAFAHASAAGDVIQTPAAAGGFATASITPTSFPATPGAPVDTVLPTEGLFLNHLTPELYKYGRVKYHAIIVRFGPNGIVDV